MPPGSTPRPGEDVVLTASHAVAVPVPGRRGGLPSLRRAALSTPVTIRGVGPDWFGGTRELPVWKGRHRSVPAKPRIVREGGGRLWRRVRAGSGKDAAIAPLARCLAALADPAPVHVPILRDLRSLGVEPYAHYDFEPDPMPSLAAAIAPDAMPGAAPVRDAGPAFAGRIAESLLHDGAALWIAVPPPLLVCDEGIRTWHGDDPEMYRADCAATTPAGAPGYLRFMEDAFHAPSIDRSALAERAAAVEQACRGLDADPLADLRHFVDRHAIGLDRAVARTLKGEHAGRLRGNPEAVRCLSTLRIVAAAASVAAAGRQSLESDLAAIGAAAECLSDRMPYASTALIVADVALSYVRQVSVPRLADRPVPDEDIATLGSLTP